jgi:MFS family permease
MGAAMTHLSMTLILTNYFEKRRGLANSFANIGGSTGGLVFPILLEISLMHYGLRGTLFIVSGLMLQAIVCGALLRPLPPDTGETNDIKLVENDDNSSNETDKETKQTDSYDKLNRTHTLPNFKTNGCQLPVTGRRRTQSENATECTKVSNLSPRTAVSVHDLQESFRKLTISSSLQPLGWLPSSAKGQAYYKRRVKEEGRTPHQIFNFSLFKNPLFYIFTLSAVLYAPTTALPISYIPPFARDCEVSDENIALLVTISAASDVLGRIGLTFIADSKTLKRHQILAMTMLMNGLSCLFVHFYTNFSTLIVFSVIYGIFGQVFFSLYPVIIVDFLGLENLRHGLTTVMLTMGSSVAIATVIIGKSTHNYAPASDALYNTTHKSPLQCVRRDILFFRTVKVSLYLMSRGIDMTNYIEYLPDFPTYEKTSEKTLQMLI